MISWEAYMDIIALHQQGLSQPGKLPPMNLWQFYNVVTWYLNEI